MRKLVLAGIFALSASTSLAQTGAAPAPAAPAESATPAAPAPTDPAAAQQAGAGGPANLCQELLAFMKAPPPEAPAPAPAAKPAAAPAQQAAPAQPAPAQQDAPAQQGTSAMAGTTGSGGAAPAKPETESNSAQAVTGQDGVATDAPKPSNEKVAAGSVANAPQKESRAAPLPPADVTSTPKESVIDVAKAEELAAANDIAVCQNTAREMRVAGVSMPPPLIALAALDLQYQQNTGAGTPPAATGQDPASQTPAPQ